MADIFIIASAIVILVAVSRWVRPVQPIRMLFLGVITGAWIWANLRNSGWQEAWSERTPDGGLDPVTRAMFWRGWPLAPVMLCVIHGNRFRPTGFEALALVINWLTLFLALSIAGYACERYLHARRKKEM